MSTSPRIVMANAMTSITNANVRRAPVAGPAARSAARSGARPLH
jgi:hypothetical protein